MGCGSSSSIPPLAPPSPLPLGGDSSIIDGGSSCSSGISEASGVVNDDIEQNIEINSVEALTIPSPPHSNDPSIFISVQNDDENDEDEKVSVSVSIAALPAVDPPQVNHLVEVIEHPIILMECSSSSSSNSRKTAAEFSRSENDDYATVDGIIESGLCSGLVLELELSSTLLKIRTDVNEQQKQVSTEEESVMEGSIHEDENTAAADEIEYLRIENRKVQEEYEEEQLRLLNKNQIKLEEMLTSVKQDNSTNPSREFFDAKTNNAEVVVNETHFSTGTPNQNSLPPLLLREAPKSFQNLYAGLRLCCYKEGFGFRQADSLLHLEVYSSPSPSPSAISSEEGGGGGGRGKHINRSDILGVIGAFEAFMASSNPDPSQELLKQTALRQGALCTNNEIDWSSVSYSTRFLVSTCPESESYWANLYHHGWIHQEHVQQRCIGKACYPLIGVFNNSGAIKPFPSRDARYNKYAPFDGSLKIFEQHIHKADPYEGCGSRENYINFLIEQQGGTTSNDTQTVTGMSRADLEMLVTLGEQDAGDYEFGPDSSRIPINMKGEDKSGQIFVLCLDLSDPRAPKVMVTFLLLLLDSGLIKKFNSLKSDLTRDGISLADVLKTLATIDALSSSFDEFNSKLIKETFGTIYSGGSIPSSILGLGLGLGLATSISSTSSTIFSSRAAGGRKDGGGGGGLLNTRDEGIAHEVKIRRLEAERTAVEEENERWLRAAAWKAIEEESERLGLEKLILEFKFNGERINPNLKIAEEVNEQLIIEAEVAAARADQEERLRVFLEQKRRNSAASLRITAPAKSRVRHEKLITAADKYEESERLRLESEINLSSTSASRAGGVSGASSKNYHKMVRDNNILIEKEALRRMEFEKADKFSRELQARAAFWFPYIDDESSNILLTSLFGMLNPNKFVGYQDRQLILTDKPALFFIDPLKTDKRGEIEWNIDMPWRAIQLSSSKFELTIPTQPNPKTFVFIQSSNDSTISVAEWVDKINKTYLLESKKKR